MRRDKRDTFSGHRTRTRMTTKLLSLTQLARRKPQQVFVSLIHILEVNFLRECFWRLKRGKSTGIDGVTLEEYGKDLEKNLKELERKLKEKIFQPTASKRGYIPKGDGRERPIGISIVEDKIVQCGLARILGAIFEVDFLDVSFGFRPSRNGKQAIDVLDEALMSKPVNIVVDKDIEKFFDTIDHEWMMKFLQQRIKDSRMLRLIRRFLKAGIMEEGKFYQVEKGTAQGSLLSPILANIYLHYALDTWFEWKIKKENKGFSQLIRYADDFVICFQKKDEAIRFSQLLEERMAKFGLRISKKKSRIIAFGRFVWKKARREGKQIETFDYLGFTFYCAESKLGKFRVGRKTSKAKYRQKLQAMNIWMKEIRNRMKLAEWWEMLRKKLNGHFQYYNIAGNAGMVAKFREETVKLAFKWINRRSQKKSYNWEKFNRFLEFNPLPRPKVQTFSRRQLELKLGMCY